MKKNKNQEENNQSHKNDITRIIDALLIVALIAAITFGIITTINKAPEGYTKICYDVPNEEIIPLEDTYHEELFTTIKIESNTKSSR